MFLGHLRRRSTLNEKQVVLQPLMSGTSATHMTCHLGFKLIFEKTQNKCTGGQRCVWRNVHTLRLDCRARYRWKAALTRPNLHTGDAAVDVPFQRVPVGAMNTGLLVASFQRSQTQAIDTAAYLVHFVATHASTAPVAEQVNKDRGTAPSIDGVISTVGALEKPHSDQDMF